MGVWAHRSRRDDAACHVSERNAGDGQCGDWQKYNEGRHEGAAAVEADRELLQCPQQRPQTDSSPKQCQQSRSQGASTSGRTCLLTTTKPILFEVGRLESAYMDWVHRPTAGRPLFFASPFMESLTKTPWWVVPLLWGPIVLACIARAFYASGLHCAATALLVAAGFALWQLLEYSIHRFIFHAQPVGYWPITLHFGFHGCHHKFPMDRERLVFPPLPAALVATAIYALLAAALPPAAVLPVFAGVLLGYLAYDCVHFALHHGALPKRGWLARIRQAHFEHHFRRPDANFGISSNLVDLLLRSSPQDRQPSWMGQHERPS